MHSSLLDVQHIKGSVEIMSTSSLVVFLGKALNEIPLLYVIRQVITGAACLQDRKVTSLSPGRGTLTNK